jgi:hypothetical protein
MTRLHLIVLAAAFACGKSDKEDKAVPPKPKPADVTADAATTKPKPADVTADARALAERGWSAYQKHDLATAEQLTRQAIAGATDDNIKAAAFYNLGRVLEDRKDRVGAIDAYKASIALRANKTVRERLRTLDSKAADALQSTAMEGPFASLRAWCDQRVVNQPTDADANQCAAAELISRTIVKLPSPFQNLGVRSLGTGSAILEAKVGGKWYFDELRPYEGTLQCSVTAAKLDNVTMHGAAIEVAYRFEGSCRLRETEWTYDERSIVIVGLGASKTPSSSPSVVVAMTETTAGRKTMDWLRKPTWNGDGSIDIAIVRSSGTTQDASVDDTEDVRGHHALTFP